MAEWETRTEYLDRNGEVTRTVEAKYAIGERVVELIIRFTHTNIKEDPFEALMESSVDDGKSWWQRYRQYAT